MRKFWIDCDAGVDDAISIFMMLSDPDVDVIGISTVAGNTLVENSTRNVLRLLEMAGRQQVNITVFAAQRNDLVNIGYTTQRLADI